MTQERNWLAELGKLRGSLTGGPNPISQATARLIVEGHEKVLARLASGESIESINAPFYKWAEESARRRRERPSQR